MIVDAGSKYTESIFLTACHAEQEVVIAKTVTVVTELIRIRTFKQRICSSFMGHGNDLPGLKTLTFVDVFLCFLIFLPSICLLSSMTHSSLGSVHTSRPLLMAKLWGEQM